MATHRVDLGDEIWIEDPSARDALRVLVLDESSGLVVIVADVNSPDVLALSACDVLGSPEPGCGSIT